MAIDLTEATTLETVSPEGAGIDPLALGRLYAQIEGHIAAGHYPGAAVALARHGKLVSAREFGVARVAHDGREAVAADSSTLWLLYSQTKPIVSCAIWHLVERGLLRWHDRVAETIPAFARHGKGNVTLYHLLTHQAGFPSAGVGPEVWDDHAALREAVCDFTLEWEPGARVVYHAGASHWVQAALIEAVTEQDYRTYLREQIVAPLGLQRLWIGVPDALHDHVAYMHLPTESGGQGPIVEVNTPEHWRAGVPGGGGYATATDLATFYQMLLGGGMLRGARIISPRTVQYVTRNHTGERIDEYNRMPMHRGLGVHVRGTTPGIRGLGSTAAPTVFGHGGVGSSYSWADPETGVSFTYLTNARSPEPWHSQRLDEIATMAHATVIDL